MDLGAERTRQLLDGGDVLELSFVELVVAATDCSEDESELFDLVDGLLESGRVRLVRPAPVGLANGEMTTAPL